MNDVKPTQVLLERYIRSRGITVQHLSNVTGIPYECIRRSFRENRTMSADEFVGIMKALNIDIKDLCGLKEQSAVTPCSVGTTI